MLSRLIATPKSRVIPRYGHQTRLSIMGKRYKWSLPPPPVVNTKNKHMSTFAQWLVYLGTNQGQKQLTKFYVTGFGVVCICFYYYMRDKWWEDQENKKIKQKFLTDPDSLTEYEHLRLKKLCNEKLKAREQKKFDLYQEMRKEYFRKNVMSKSTFDYSPTPEELNTWYDAQPKRVQKTAPVDGEESETKSSVEAFTMAAEAKENDHEKADSDEEKSDRVSGPQISNKDNPNIMQGTDTTEFFDKKAEAYDKEVNWEERAVFMGMRRREMMSKLEGDVLEVACGTGRNIKYLNTEKIDSITFLDSSEKMVEITREKFIKKFPKFKKVAFTVGKAEELDKLTVGSDIKYDTIVETFGLCSHEDPVAALKNMTKLLRPGGRIVLLEHGRGTWNAINNHLDFRADKRMKTWACRWNLDIGELIEDAGLDITYEKRVHFGTTWMLVCKKPEDPLNMSERPFLDKLFGRTRT